MRTKRLFSLLASLVMLGGVAFAQSTATVPINGSVTVPVVPGPVGPMGPMGPAGPPGPSGSGSLTTPVTILDTNGASTNIPITSTWAAGTIMDTGPGTIVVGEPGNGANGTFFPNWPVNIGAIATNSGWQNFIYTQPVTTPFAMHCRYQNTINNAFEPNLIGSNAVWETPIYPGPTGFKFTMHIPQVTIQRACVVNASCSGPLNYGDVLRIEMQCYADQPNMISAIANGGDMFTTFYPAP